MEGHPIVTGTMAALIGLAIILPGDIRRLHQGLRQHAVATAQDIPVLFLEELTNERGRIHLGFAIGSTPP